MSQALAESKVPMAKLEVGASARAWCKLYDPRKKAPVGEVLLQLSLGDQ
jgi:hypothetical protein